MDVIFNTSNFDWVTVQVLQRTGHIGIDLDGQSDDAFRRPASLSLGLSTERTADFCFGYALSASFSATRNACAAIVSAGLQAADEGKNELSTT